MLTKFNALIIEPDASARRRLREATRSSTGFSTVLQASGFDKVSQALRDVERCDVLFISSRLSQDDISEFINDSKDIFAMRDAARVLLLENDKKDSSAVAASMLNGVDGFLVEPYSFNALQEITELANRVKKERSEGRERAAIGFLLNEIMAQIDQIAELKKSGFPASISERGLKEMCSVIHRLDPDAQKRYVADAVSAFMEAPLPKDAPAKSYRGASQRVRKKATSRAIERMRAAFAAN